MMRGEEAISTESGLVRALHCLMERNGWLPSTDVAARGIDKARYTRQGQIQ